MSEVKRRIAEFKSFEVRYADDGSGIVEDYKGITRGPVSKDIAKLAKRRRRRRIPKSVIKVLENVALNLISHRVPFKVVFGTNDATIYLDIDHFIHVYSDKITIAGFKALEEVPLAYIRDILRSHAPIKFLKPLK